MKKLFSSSVEILIEKATSETLPTGAEQLEANLEIADAIKSKEIGSKDAIAILKKRLSHKNANVHLLTLELMDFCAKNGGHHFLIELSSISFTQFLSEHIKNPSCHFQVKEKLLEYIQVWGIAFSKDRDLLSMTKLYRSLKAEGYPFPPTPEISADFFQSETVPEWENAPVCNRCRTTFTLTVRKHHCRKCGHTFCSNCSNNTMPLPKLGINKPVRVCNSCYFMSNETINNSKSASSESIDKLKNSKSREILEDENEQLNLALKLSLEEHRKSSITKKDEMEDPLVAAAIAASLNDSSRSAQRSQALYFENIASSSKLPILEPYNEKEYSEVKSKFCLSPNDADKIRRLYEAVSYLYKHTLPIDSNTKSMYRELYSHQVKLQRDINRIDSIFNELNTSAETLNDCVIAFNAAHEDSFKFKATSATHELSLNRNDLRAVAIPSTQTLGFDSQVHHSSCYPDTSYSHQLQLTQTVPPSQLSSEVNFPPNQTIPYEAIYIQQPSGQQQSYYSSPRPMAPNNQLGPTDSFDVPISLPLTSYYNQNPRGILQEIHPPLSTQVNPYSMSNNAYFNTPTAPVCTFPTQSPSHHQTFNPVDQPQSNYCPHLQAAQQPKITDQPKDTEEKPLIEF